MRDADRGRLARQPRGGEHLLELARHVARVERPAGACGEYQPRPRLISPQTAQDGAHRQCNPQRAARAGRLGFAAIADRVRLLTTQIGELALFDGVPVAA